MECVDEPVALTGTRAKTKSAYHFFETGDNSMERILAPHYETIVSRPAHERVVLIPRKGKQPPREARLEIRFATVTLKPPRNKPNLRGLEIEAIIEDLVLSDLICHLNTESGVKFR